VSIKHASALVDDFRTFPMSLQGKVRSRHHAEYAGWHKALTWNGRSFERYPEYIVRPASEDDVVRTVNFARSHGLRLSVRGGGHSYGACFLRQGGILLDMSSLRHIQIDAINKRAVVQPGVTSRELSEALAIHGLAFPTGHGGSVAISGFLLGGGIGINSTAWGGVSVFNVEAMDIITADGEMHHVSAECEPELFWAARGAGPAAFFVVVRFYLICHELPPAMTSCAYRVPFDRLGRLLTEIDRIRPDPSLQVMMAVVPAEDDVASVSYEVLLNTVAFAQNSSHAKAMHEAFVSQLPPDWLKVVAEDGSMTFASFYEQTDSMFTLGRYRTDNILTDRPAMAVEILALHLYQVPSRATVPLILWRGEHAFPNAAYSAKGRFFISTYAQWSAGEDDEVNREWLRQLYDDLKSVASGHYINEFDIETRAADVEHCFSESHWQRLMALRHRYDPERIFHEITGLSGRT